MPGQDNTHRSDDDRDQNIEWTIVLMEALLEFRKQDSDKAFWTTWTLIIVAVVTFSLGYNLR